MDDVWVPARPVRGADGDEPGVELRTIAATGERVGLAFSSPRALARALGEHQPWVTLPLLSYVAWLRMQGVYRLQLDPVYATDARQWSAEDLAFAIGEG
jgi:hypothetical protein